MAQQVCNMATLSCSFGLAPSALSVLPMNRVFTGGQPAATVQDHAPFVNIRPFGMCTSLANPQVAAATAAAMGVLVPQPCIPNTPSPWLPGSPTALVGYQPSLNNSSKLMCVWAGVISVVMPGQMRELVP
jgi:hypothetical protein